MHSDGSSSLSQYRIPATNVEWLPPLHRLFVAGEIDHTHDIINEMACHMELFYLLLLREREGGGGHSTSATDIGFLDNWGLLWMSVWGWRRMPQADVRDEWRSITWFMSEAVSLWPVSWPVIMLQHHGNWEKCRAGGRRTEAWVGSLRCLKLTLVLFHASGFLLPMLLSVNKWLILIDSALIRNDVWPILLISPFPV